MTRVTRASLLDASALVPGQYTWIQQHFDQSRMASSNLGLNSLKQAEGVMQVDIVPREERGDEVLSSRTSASSVPSAPINQSKLYPDIISLQYPLRLIKGRA